MPTTITKRQHRTTSRVFRVDEIRPNPFRAAIERYPLQEKKIEALCESIRTTGFWDNVVARIGEDGKPEIAYGHHRLEAVHRELGDDAQVGLIIRELDDETMLQIMVQENMTEWATSAITEQESVRAVVLAYGTARIKLSLPDPKASHAKLRFAPSFLQGGDDPNVHLDHRRRRYTSTTVAKFLGWHEEKVRIVLQALELMELEILEPSMFEGLGPTRARALVEGVRKVAQEIVCDVPKSWKADNEPRAFEADRRLLRNHVKRKVAAWQAAKGNYTQGLNPLAFANVKKKGGKGKSPVCLKGYLGPSRSKTLLEYAQSPVEQYPRVVARFIQVTEDLVQQASTKKPAVKERRRVYQLLAQVRKGVDTLEATLGGGPRSVEKKKRGAAPIARSKPNNKGKSRGGAKTARLASSGTVS